MNCLPRRKSPRCAPYWLVAVLALMFSFSQLLAQPAGDPPGRWLFVFGTSSTMKKYLPATEAEIRMILALSVNQEMHGGDSIGVWTLNGKLGAGQFPLTVWDPGRAAMTSSNMIEFIRRQHYSGGTHFKMLERALGDVVENSPRLTVLIFCDGEDDIHFTSYADDINKVFHDRLADRKKKEQPFVLVLRTQLGRFAGITVNLPPGELNLPVFPPLPLPPTSEAAPAPAPVAPPPPVMVPPLIIVGTNVGTNLDQLEKMSAPGRH